MFYYFLQVNLAAQTLSSSVAKGIQYAKDLNLPEFQGSEATIEWILTIDR